MSYVMKYVSLPKDNLVCEAEIPDKAFLKHVVTDPNSNWERVMRNTDTADVMVVTELFKGIFQKNVKHALIIAGDSDYGYLLTKCALDVGLDLMFAYPKERVHHSIKELACHARLWTSEDPNDNELLLINGGA
ncbi:PIN domain-like protein [Raphanus sativus]|nr:PIN domain-like protein [Raphanus sativus]